MNEFSSPVDGEEAVDFAAVQPETADWFGGIFTAAPIIMAAFVLFFMAVVGFGIFLAVRNHKAGKRAGIDPFTLQTDLAARAAHSHLLAPTQTREQHLAEICDLLARGKITREEYELARLRILTD